MRRAFLQKRGESVVLDRMDPQVWRAGVIDASAVAHAVDRRERVGSRPLWMALRRIVGSTAADTSDTRQARCGVLESGDDCRDCLTIHPLQGTSSTISRRACERGQPAQPFDRILGPAVRSCGHGALLVDEVVEFVLEPQRPKGRTRPGIAFFLVPGVECPGPVRPRGGNDVDPRFAEPSHLADELPSTPIRQTRRAEGSSARPARSIGWQGWHHVRRLPSVPPSRGRREENDGSGRDEKTRARRW